MIALLDIGAGSGAKMAIADAGGNTIAESFLPVADYGRSGDEFADRLAEAVSEMSDGRHLLAASLAVPGIPCGDVVRQCTNLPFLSGFPLAEALRTRLRAPVRMLNDGDAGGLGEWSVRRHALIYWALGGGWGGAWVSDDGRLVHPSSEFNGKDESLHISAEPGFLLRMNRGDLATILKRLAVRSDWLPDGDSIRIERLVSGPGRLRIFRAVADDDACAELDRTGDAGATISALHRAGNEGAVRTDTVFGTLLGEAAVRILRAVNRESGQPPLTVYVGGGVARSLDLFLPHAQKVLESAGIGNAIFPSLFLTSGGKANLAGALLHALTWKGPCRSTPDPYAA